MALPERHKISIRINHPDLSAREIIENVELPAAVIQSVGESRATPTGTPLEGRYTKTYVVFHPELAGSSLEGDIQQLLTELSPASNKFLANLNATGGRVELFIGLFDEASNIMFDLNPDLLRSLGERGIGLLFDVYLDDN